MRLRREIRIVAVPMRSRVAPSASIGVACVPVGTPAHAAIDWTTIDATTARELAAMLTELADDADAEPDDGSAA